MISCSNAPQSLPNKQIKNKTCRVVIKYPNKNWTPRNASWTSDSISKPKPAWAVKFHPVLRGTKLSGRCVLPKDALHPSSSLQFSQRFMHWMRAELWHNVVTPAAKSENQESCQTFRKGSSGGWGKTWKYQKFLLRKSMNFSSVKEPAHNVTGSIQLWHLCYWK